MPLFYICILLSNEHDFSCILSFSYYIMKIMRNKEG